MTVVYFTTETAAHGAESVRVPNRALDPRVCLNHVTLNLGRKNRYNCHRWCVHLRSASILGLTCDCFPGFFICKVFCVCDKF